MESQPRLQSAIYLIQRCGSQGWVKLTVRKSLELDSLDRGCKLAGYIQAQICQTGKCPTGVATQNKWLMRGLDPVDKAARFANYITTLRKEILQLCHACGVEHPAMITNSFEILGDGFESRSVNECFGLQGCTTTPCGKDIKAITELMKNLPPVKK